MDSDGYYAEPAADEIFSGPTHELVPSSVSSFHHYRAHSFGRRRSSSISRASGPLSEYEQRSEDEPGSAEFDGFRFFSRDEVENVEAASTIGGDHESFENESQLHRPPLHLPHTFDYGASSDEGVDVGDEQDFEYPSERMKQGYYIAEEDMRIVAAGYCKVQWRIFAYYVLCCITFGLGYILLSWFPRFRLRLIARESTLGSCDSVVVENQWGELEIVDVHCELYGQNLSTIFNVDPPERHPSERDYVDEDPLVPVLRLLNYRYIRFIYNPVKDMFMTNSDWKNYSWGSRATAEEGLDSETQAHREQVFGKNSLEIRQPSIFRLLHDEVLHPFYIFQVFSIILWAYDDYMYYASAIFIISVFSVAEALSETKKGMKRLAEIANEECEIKVLRSGFWKTIPSSEVVPGDVYELSDPNLDLLPCDSLLLAGDAIVNESILTGESVPVSKVPASDAALAHMVAEGLDVVQRSLLYAGTKIIRVRKPGGDDEGFKAALGMAVHTGFLTTKGALLRSMMFPRPNGFKFYRDSFRYISVMALIAFFGFVISAVNFRRMGLPTSLIVVRALDLITIVVPPALPATLTIGTNIALSRLRKRGIFCITPSRVNVGGRVDAMCFDKTGTLTEEGLDVLGAHLCSDRRFSPLIRKPENIPPGPFEDTLATCHELRVVDGEPMGDPLDAKMFDFIGWFFDEKPEFRHFSPPERGERDVMVVKQFEFVPQLRRMSVVASGSARGPCVFAKGAPEVMRDICKPESFPASFDDLLYQYTHRGYRVIACAWRNLQNLSDYTREQVECDLEFCGLIIFENKLKPQSAPVIRTLRNAGIGTIMCTGDNVLTGISVAREADIISPNQLVFAAHLETQQPQKLVWECMDNPSMKLSPQLFDSGSFSSYTLAVTGEIFSHIVEHCSTEELEHMLTKGSVYARMSPDEKHELVTRLQHLERTVGFCGDGANDCGALKEADVGISLSEAEASVAAPFTSRRFDISCVIDVLTEGRCSLVTSFSCFKYMSLYSAIQFITVTILYSYGSNIGDFQFLWIDLFLIVPIAVFMAWSEPSPNLCRRRPGAELVSRNVLVPLIGSMAIFLIFQVIIWLYAHRQPWFIPPDFGNDDNLKSTDNTALFDISSFQYIFAGWFLCEGPPFRKPVLTNLPFLATMLVTIIMTLVFVFINPDTRLGNLMDMSPVSTTFRIVVLIMAAVNFGALWAADAYLFKHICSGIKSLRRSFRIPDKLPRYKELQHVFSTQERQSV